MTSPDTPNPEIPDAAPPAEGSGATGPAHAARQPAAPTPQPPPAHGNQQTPPPHGFQQAPPPNAFQQTPPNAFEQAPPPNAFQQAPPPNQFQQPHPQHYFQQGVAQPPNQFAQNAGQFAQSAAEGAQKGVEVAKKGFASAKEFVAALPIKLSMALRVVGIIFLAWGMAWTGVVGFYDEDIPAIAFIFLLAVGFLGASEYVRRTELDSKQGNFDSGPGTAAATPGAPGPGNPNPAPLKAQFSAPVGKVQFMESFSRNLALPQEPAALKMTAYLGGFEADSDGEGTGMVMMNVGNFAANILGMTAMVTEGSENGAMKCAGGAFSVAWKNTRGTVDLKPHVDHFFGALNATVEQLGGTVEYEPSDLTEPML